MGQIDQCAAKDTKLVETLRLQAQVYKEKENYKEGARVCRDWLALTTKLYGPRSAQTNQSQTVLTEMLIGLLEYDQAEELLKKSIKTISDKYGQEDLYIAEPRRWLGNVYTAQGYHSKGEEALRQALAIQKDHLDKNDEQIISTSRDLAHCLLLQRKREAYDVLVQMLAACEKTGSPQLAAVLQELADTETEVMGMFRAAQAHLDRIFKEKKILTVEQIGTLNAQKARLCLLSGDWKTARELYQMSLANYQKERASDVPETSVSARIKAQLYKGLAVTSLESGDLKSAEDELDHAVKEESLSHKEEDMPQLFHLYSLQAQLYCELKETAKEGRKSQDLYWFFIEHKLSNKQLYFEQTVVDDAYERIAHYAQHHANFEWGRKIFELGHQQAEKKNGKNSSQAGLLSFFLGKLCRRFANSRPNEKTYYTLAEKYYADSLRVMEINHDESNEYWDGLLGYGQCLQVLGKYSQAEACYRRLLVSKNLAQGRLADAHRQLAEVLNLQGKIQEAKEAASNPVPVSIRPTVYYLQPDQPQK